MKERSIDMKRFLVVIIAAVAVLTAAVVYAQMGNMGDRPGMKGDRQGRMWTRMHGTGNMEKMAEQLGLDANQKAQMMRLREDFRLTMVDKKAELEKAQIKLRGMMSSSAPDKDVLAAMDKLGLLRTDIQKLRYQHRQQMKAVLTPDQQNKLKELWPKMMFGDGDDEAGPQMRHMGGGRGMGPGGMMGEGEDNMGSGMHRCNKQCGMMDD